MSVQPYKFNFFIPICKSTQFHADMKKINRFSSFSSLTNHFFYVT